MSLAAFFKKGKMRNEIGGGKSVVLGVEYVLLELLLWYENPILWLVEVLTSGSGVISNDGVRILA